MRCNTGPKERSAKAYSGIPINTFTAIGWFLELRRPEHPLAPSLDCQKLPEPKKLGCTFDFDKTSADICRLVKASQPTTDRDYSVNFYKDLHSTGSCLKLVGGILNSSFFRSTAAPSHCLSGLKRSPIYKSRPAKQ